MALKEILEVLAAVTGRTAPRFKAPHWVAAAAGYMDNLAAALTGREPRIPLEGVRMSRHKMFVDCSKATADLGFKARSVETALERAARWYMDNGFVSMRKEVTTPCTS
jgi:dihydroflavonol-4-reductase